MDQWFPAGDSFAPPPSPRGDSWSCVDTFSRHNYRGAADTQPVEARTAGNSPTLRRTAGAAKNDQAQNINSAEVTKSWCGFLYLAVLHMDRCFNFKILKSV